MGNVALPQKNEVIYYIWVCHLDRRLTWAKHIRAKRNQLNLKVKRNVLATGKKFNTVHVNGT
jgi:hypothetical protein